jgi:hypothetical protein
MKNCGIPLCWTEANASARAASRVPFISVTYVHSFLFLFYFVFRLLLLRACRAIAIYILFSVRGKLTQ